MTGTTQDEEVIRTYVMSWNLYTTKEIYTNIIGNSSSWLITIINTQKTNIIMSLTEMAEPQEKRLRLSAEDVIVALDTSFGDIDDDEDGPVMPGSDDELEDLQWDDEEEFEDTLPSAVESLATLSLSLPPPLSRPQ